MHALLARLENLPEDRYVLHGSPHKLSNILPRQTLMDGGIPEYQEYAIYGTQYVPVAVLYANIHVRRDWWGWSLDGEGVLVIRSMPGVVITPQPGCIHLLPQAPFTKRVLKGMTCLAYEPLTPLEHVDAPVALFEHLVAIGSVRIDTGHP